MSTTTLPARNSSLHRHALVRTLVDPDREPQERPLDLAIIRRLWQLMSAYRGRRGSLIVLVLLRAMQLPLIAWAIGAVINGPISDGASLTAIAWGGLAVLGLSLVTQVTFYYRSKLALELGEAVVHDLRELVFAKLQRMPLSFYQQTKIGRIISRITSDCEAVRVGVQDVLFVSLVQLGQMIGAGALMAWCDPQLFLVVAAFAPIVWLINRIFRGPLSGAYRGMQESFSRVTSTLAESVSGIRVTQGFAREDANAEAFAHLVEDHSRVVQKAGVISGAFYPLLELGSQVALAAALLIGGLRALRVEDPLPVGDLIQFWFLAGMFFSPIQVLGQQYNQALTAMAGAERVFRLLDLEPAWQDKPDAIELPEGAGRVELDGVWFGYDPETPVLKDVSLVAEPGQCIALVGATGSGKSTLTSLIARYFLADRGTVRIDGYDMREISGPSLARQLAVVLQQNYLFSGTVFENLQLSRPNATRDDVKEALRALDCEDLLDQLPDGLETQVGSRGAQLSLGQRQLLCFARALLANPRILILDEATSAVDTLTERRLQRALRLLMAGRTSFVVAHRLSTIEAADQILVLDQGRIIQRGTHEELLHEPGPYARLAAHNRTTHDESALPCESLRG